MSDKKELEVMEPQHGFWEVCIEILVEDSDTGKVKKVKENHLVDGVNLQDVEESVAEEMKGTMSEWKIKSCKQSKIQYVY